MTPSPHGLLQYEFFVKKPFRPIWPHVTPEFLKAFWEKVKISGPNDCWPWLGVSGYGGYGQFSFRGVTFVASRVSLTIASERDHIDFMTLHSCDNPPCVNPAHLFCGNDLTNVKDRVTKGRHRGSVKIPENANKWNSAFSRL